MQGKNNLTGLVFAILFMVLAADAAYGWLGAMEGDGGGNGPHYAGKDCMSCHKGGEHNLLVGGTVFAAYNSAVPCAGASLQLLDPATNAVVYATKNYYSEDANGTGNFYIKSASFAEGSYTMRIISADGSTLAQSGGPHSFSGNTNTTNLNNRYSCNSCHATPPSNGAVGPIYAQQNTSKCSNASAYTPYDGQTLYNTYCASCHNAGSYGAQPIAGVPGKGDDVSIVKNAITTNKNRAGVATNMNVLSFLSNAQLQSIVNYTYPVSEAMPLPEGQFAFSVNAVETPVISANYQAAAPIGIGNLSGGFLNWQAGLTAFSGPVDILVAVKLNNYLYFLDSNNALTQSMSVWKTVSGGKTSESITENIGIGSGNLPLSTLSAGTYTLYLAVLPAGNLSAGDTSKYYLWSTQFTH